MANPTVLNPRVQETTTTTGAGNYTLSGTAVVGFVTVSASPNVVNGSIFQGHVEAVDANGVPTGAWEEGLYTWNTGNTLTRTEIFNSSNAGAAVSWAAGTKRVAMSMTAELANSGLRLYETASASYSLGILPTSLTFTGEAFGQVITLPDARKCSRGGSLFTIHVAGNTSVKIVDNTGVALGVAYAGGIPFEIGLTANTTQAGVWTMPRSRVWQKSAFLLSTTLAFVVKVIALDANRELLIGHGLNGANLYGVVYDSSTRTFGTVTLIDTMTFGVNASLHAATAKLLATNSTLVTYLNTTGSLFGVVLTTSGTTITVNTRSSVLALGAATGFFDATDNILTLGSTYVVCTSSVAAAGSVTSMAAAFTVSGTTVTIGSVGTAIGWNTTASAVTAKVIDATTFITASYNTGNALIVYKHTVSGVTITSSAALSITTTTTSVTVGTGPSIRMGTIGGYFLVPYQGGSGLTLAVITVSGATPTANSLVLGSGALVDMQVLAGCVVISNATNIYRVTVSAGTGTLTGSITTATGLLLVQSNGNYVYATSSTLGAHYKYDLSGSTPTLAAVLSCTGMNVGGFSRSDLTIPEQYQWDVTNTLRSSYYPTYEWDYAAEKGYVNGTSSMGDLTGTFYCRGGSYKTTWKGQANSYTGISKTELI